MKNKINKWKIAFISLVTSFAVILIGGIVLFYLFIPESISDNEVEREQKGEESRFVITTTRRDLQHFIDENTANENSHHFNITLSELVRLETSIPLFGREIPVQLDLQPELYRNGDLLLKERSFRVADIQLPSERLFQLISFTIDFPEWIKVDAKQASFNVLITEIDAFENFFLKVSSFDLVEDQIVFELVSKNSNN